MTSRIAPVVVVALLLAGCTGRASPTGSTALPPATSTSSGPATAPPAPAVASLACDGAIDGGPVPADWQTVLGVVALPTSPAYPALQASDSGDPSVPALFAKTGLLVRAGRAFDLVVLPEPGNPVAIGWGNVSFQPSRRFVVPPCPDQYGTGWLAYPGGYWADRPLCLPLTVRAGGREQQVRIGIGTPCSGQEPPA